MCRTSKFYDPLVWYLSGAAMHGYGQGTGKKLVFILHSGNHYGNGFGYGFSPANGCGLGYGRHLGNGNGHGYRSGIDGEAYGCGIGAFTELNRARLF